MIQSRANASATALPPWPFGTTWHEGERQLDFDPVIFFGLADYSVQEVIEFYPSREEAEETLRQVLEDEPAFENILEVVTVDLGDTSPN